MMVPTFFATKGGVWALGTARFIRVVTACLDTYNTTEVTHRHPLAFHTHLHKNVAPSSRTFSPPLSTVSSAQSSSSLVQVKKVVIEGARNMTAYHSK